MFKNVEKMAYQPDMINTTLDNGRSLRQLIISVSFFLAFKVIGKVKIMLNFD